MQRKNKHNSLQNKLDEAGQKKMQEVNISIYVQMLTPYIYIYYFENNSCFLLLFIIYQMLFDNMVLIKLYLSIEIILNH